MRLGFLRCGGKFHVRGERRKLRAVPVGAHAGTDTRADAAADAPTNAAAHAKTVVAADARTVAAPDGEAYAGTYAGAR